MRVKAITNELANLFSFDDDRRESLYRAMKKYKEHEGQTPDENAIIEWRRFIKSHSGSS